MDSVSSVKRPCFVEEVDGLASLAGNMEAGFSGNQNQRPFYARPLCYSRSSFRNLSSMSGFASSPRSTRLHDARFDESHFLKTCYFCKKQLSNDKDIYMYRGDIPFCSLECREEQIQIDEAKENLNQSSSMKALRQNEQKQSNSSNKKQDYPFRIGAVAAA